MRPNNSLIARGEAVRTSAVGSALALAARAQPKYSNTERTVPTPDPNSNIGHHQLRLANRTHPERVTANPGRITCGVLAGDFPSRGRNCKPRVRRRSGAHAMTFALRSGSLARSKEEQGIRTIGRAPRQHSRSCHGPRFN
jgi:hypothetical protein